MTIKHSTLPDHLRLLGEEVWERLLDAAVPQKELLVRDKRVGQSAIPVFVFSPFVSKSCLRDPHIFCDLLVTGDLFKGYHKNDFHKSSRKFLSEVKDERGLSSQLRRFRRREMIRIAWRDLAGWASLDETMRDLTLLAETCLNRALSHLCEWERERLGDPRGNDGRDQGLVVLGMGKLGAGELNFSSDIDLIFAYPEQGHTSLSQKKFTNDEFFTSVARKLISQLGANSEEGFVFRVDTRLRPFGESGPLVLSFDGMEEYYQLHGREWERYAFIKARPVAGDLDEGARLIEIMRPFVYRRYLDFGAFESLRQMKQMIEEEVHKKGVLENIKLGKGGIREIEFIGQTFQLIRGGRIPELQAREIQTVLTLLGEMELLPGEVCSFLKKSYRFLRYTEHRLQEYNDQQTHTLPKDEDSRLRLALSMGFPSWDQFYAELKSRMDLVHTHFEELFAPSDRGGTATGSNAFSAIWIGASVDEDVWRRLKDLGFNDPHKVVRLLEDFKKSRKVQTLGYSGKELLERLISKLESAFLHANHPEESLKRILSIIEAIGRRDCYLSLLLENPSALENLVKLCDKAAWIARLISQHPILLDELIDPRTLFNPPDRRELESSLKGAIYRSGDDDLEFQMDELRHFRQASMLRIAAADISGPLGVEQVGESLSDVAEVVLNETLELSWRHLAKRRGLNDREYGTPRGFCVIGYGKLGGRELGYGSDLDLVFLHESSGKGCGVEFFTRVGQRMIHILTARTSAGILYEVDMRLRPDGASGVLVSSMKGFHSYQRSHAWTWEHQALVRARFVAGDPDLRDEFKKVRRDILCAKRDPHQLKAAIKDMKDTVSKNLGSKDTGLFDIKYDPGGLIDIEFVVQYLVLKEACNHPDIVEYTNCLVLLNQMKERELIDTDAAEDLRNAYLRYRKEINRLSLEEVSHRVDKARFNQEAERVRQVWDMVLGQ